MTGLNIGYVILGAVMAVAGLVMLVIAIRSRRQRPDDPKGVAMLIAAMMIFAFGLTLAGFAIGFATTKPLDLNNAEAVQ